MTTNAEPSVHPQRRLGVLGLAGIAVASSAPLIVLAGGATTIFAITGNPTYPLAIIVVAALLALFVVGYAAMSREVVSAGGFYSYVARGLGPVAAGAAGVIAVLAYNAIQISLYGLLGAVLADLLGQPWWLCALVAIAAVGVLGVLRIDISAAVIAVLLTCEVIAVIIYDVAALSAPAADAGGAPVFALDGFSPALLFGAGGGAVIAFAAAAFIGFEQAALYSEEVRDPKRTVARATILALTFIAIFYALSTWAMTVAVGPAALQAAAGEAGPGLVFAVLAGVWPPLADIASILLITSIFAGLLGLHHAAARYHHALGRERVLPAALGRTSRSGTPLGGSLTQTALAIIGLAATLAIGGANAGSANAMFAGLSGLAAVAMITLLVITSIAVYAWKPNTQISRWSNKIAPALAAVGLAAALGLVVLNFGILIGDPTAALAWALPLLVVLAAALGALRVIWLRRQRPEAFERIAAQTALR